MSCLRLLKNIGKKNVESKQIKPPKLHWFAKAEDSFKHRALETTYSTLPL